MDLSIVEEALGTLAPASSWEEPPSQPLPDPLQPPALLCLWQMIT